MFGINFPESDKYCYVNMSKKHSLLILPLKFT